MSNLKITNEILYELIKEFKGDINRRFEEIEKRLNRIDEACDNLLKLYENMEYFLKKEIDNVEIVDFELKKFLNIAILKFNDLKGNIQIIINTPPITITTDKSGFELVIDNLISNSIKHNKKINTINIDLQNDILIFRDDGEGIDTKIIYKVFNRYFQNSDTSKGFGIGLNIVKEFCDKHKIDIKIETSSNGTLFKLNLKNIISNLKLKNLKLINLINIKHP